MNKLILLEHKVYKYKILEISLHLVHNCFLPFCNKYSNKISVIQSNMDIHFKNGHRVKFVEKKDYLNCHSSFFNTVIHDYIGKGLKQSQLTRNNPYKTHLMVLNNILRICSINSHHIGLYIYIYMYIYIYESYHSEYKEYLLFQKELTNVSIYIYTIIYI